MAGASGTSNIFIGHGNTLTGVTKQFLLGPLVSQPPSSLTNSLAPNYLLGGDFASNRLGINLSNPTYNLDVNGYAPIEIIKSTAGIKFSARTEESLRKGPGGQPRYITFSGGEEDDVRRICLDIFNANFNELPVDIKSLLVDEMKYTDNKTGQLCRVFCITSAGAEGISLKSVRAVHIMEPYWNWMRITQIIGRAVRYLSHDELPKKDRTVQPYIYINDYPTKIEKSNELFKTEKTTDEYMYSRALQFNKLITSFYNAISEASIDCSIHNNNPKLHCRLCTPTGEPLYLDDIRKDMQMRSPCNRMDKKEITADEYIIGENKYAVYEGVVLKFHPELDGYIELERNDPLYSELLVKAGL
jgi:hypothetical protein